jgi:hypothetical protein
MLDFVTSFIRSLREKNKKTTTSPTQHVLRCGMSISTIRNRYYKIARKLEAPSLHIQFATKSQHDGRPHVELIGAKLHYVRVERGHEFERRETSDPDELLFWLISDITWSMASDWELANRIEEEDSRKQLFRKDIELMSIVNQDWADRKRIKYEKLLGCKYPFDNSQDKS